MRLDALRQISLFAGLDEKDLQGLADMLSEVRLAAGEMLFREGDAGGEAYVIQSGRLEVLKASAGREMLLALRGPGELIGEVALFDEAPRMASVKAHSDSVLLAIPKRSFDELLSSSRTLLHAMFREMLARLRGTQAAMQQSENLAQLGTLTAGVAHELNNPAAAIQRGAEQLQSSLAALLAARSALDGLAMPKEKAARAEALHAEAQARATAPAGLDALERSDRMAALEAGLHGRGLPTGGAGQLADLGYTPATLDELAAQFAPQELAAVLAWLGASYAAHALLAEIGAGARRVSAIVGALKSYTYLDQAPVQAVDLHAGIEDTLLILGSKLRGGVNVKRRYAPDLPAIQGYGSELNQVWTNILDNAIAAMDGQGEIEIETRLEGDWAVVAFEDNGPGIPEAIQPRVFDAFFTTKPPGQGSGLGLNISYNVVVHKHGGDILLSSEPGGTRFEVWLPASGARR
ncbi:MAG: cyclic nucleotide-binding domain-containing protein [Anaerolineales bacterium]|nr:cyclic nucleotide-binding domain-containing protein [Anaerolineales bacterium]